MSDARWPGWPFPSTDKRVIPQPSDQQEPKLCECDDSKPLTGQEVSDNRCATCGKAIA